MAAMPLLCPATSVVRAASSSAWQAALPELVSPRLVLREVREADAVSLVSMLGSPEVGRYIEPPPASPASFARFIAWAAHERAEGGHACYAIVPAGTTTAVGLFQLRPLEPSLGVIEWGFALGSAYWGTGLFEEAARLMLHFAFDIVGALRVEARAVAANGRGNGALRKLGAVQEGVLRRSFVRDGRCHDQLLWAILAEDWAPHGPALRVTVH
jgi:RimJ/RimL family protein N-acetyltransferase